MNHWPPASVRSRITDLREVSTTLQSLDLKTTPGPLRVAMARYVTVRAAGFVEAVRDDVADFFVERIALDVITNRVRSGLRGGLGARPQQLIDFVGSFHRDWANELTQFLDDESGTNRRSELGALVNARKKIAHGDGDSVKTLDALRWAATAEEIGDWLIKRFDPSRNYYEPVRFNS